jgi:hypothetical protein
LIDTVSCAGIAAAVLAPLLVLLAPFAGPAAVEEPSCVLLRVLLAGSGTSAAAEVLDVLAGFWLLSAAACAAAVCAELWAWLLLPAVSLAGTVCDVLAAGSLLLWVMIVLDLCINCLLSSGRCTGCLIWFKLLLLHHLTWCVEASCDLDVGSIIIDLFTCDDHSNQRPKHAARLLAAKRSRYSSRLWVSTNQRLQ